LPSKKNEAVTVSFHYLCRVAERDSEKQKTIPFKQADFDHLFDSVQHKPKPNLNDEEEADRIRFRMDAPLKNVVRVDKRTICGTYSASYWGHAYDNSARGRIPADSISLRPFHFLLYLSDSGRIYIATQYLGQFGGYTALQRTICDLLPQSDEIVANSFRLDSSLYKTAHAKEIRVTFSDRSHSISQGNSLTQGGMVAFRKRSKDDGFEEQVSKRLFPFLGRSKTDVKKAVAALVSESKLLEVTDDDIEDCTVIATVNGRKKTIYMLESGNFATRFPIEVSIDKDGHPNFEPTKHAMIKLLKNEIIARREDA
jgi:hypothetical protein